MSAELRGFGPRTYRTQASEGPGRVPFRVEVETTDLFLRADRNLAPEALALARKARGAVAAHCRAHPAFATALAPLAPPDDALPPVVAAMYRAADAAGVGPMAAVAGAIAGAVGRGLRTWSREALVENGGDLYLDLAAAATVGLFAGASPWTGRVGLRVAASQTPLGVCTSSGTVGPSLSFGRADAAVVLAPDPALADAVATAVGNRIKTPGDLEAAVAWALTIPGVTGAVAVLGTHLAAVGDVELVEIEGEGNRE